MISSALGAAHLTSALAAMALGGAVMLERKGTLSHRVVGAGYVVAMVIVNLTALAIYRLTGRFGPFHALAIMSLATVAGGAHAAILRPRGWLQRHSYTMAWSYVGLLAAAAAEMVVRVPALAGLINSAARATAVGVAVAVLFTIVGFVALPRLQRRALASMERTPSPGGVT